MDTIELVKNNDKTAFLMDASGHAIKFFKYKGNVIDITEYYLKEEMG